MHFTGTKFKKLKFLKFRIFEIFTFNSRMSSYCHCSVALPHGAVGLFTGWQFVIVVFPDNMYLFFHTNIPPNALYQNRLIQLCSGYPEIFDQYSKA